MSAKKLIETFTEKKLNVPFIMMTGLGDEQVAVDMIELGAYDYLQGKTSC